MNIFNDITLIYVSYKSDVLFKKNIDIIKLFNTVIVDNYNDSQLSDYLKNFPKIKYIKNKKNLGFGFASNLGVKNATTPYVLILNPDITFDLNSIKNLYNGFLFNKNCGVAGPSLYSPEGFRRSNSSLSYVKKKIYRNKLGRNIYKKLCDNLTEGDLCCDYIIGCSMLFEKSFFLEIGGFDVNFFMYFEDNDICDQVRINKKTVLEIPLSKMRHLQGLSTEKSFKLDSALAIIHKISEYKYLKKNISYLKLVYLIIINAIDFFQRIVFNLFLFRFKNLFKNFLRLISIFLFVTGLHRYINFLN